MCFLQNSGFRVECALQPLLTALCPSRHSNLTEVSATSLKHLWPLHHRCDSSFAEGIPPPGKTCRTRRKQTQSGPSPEQLTRIYCQVARNLAFVPSTSASLSRWSPSSPLHPLTVWDSFPVCFCSFLVLFKSQISSLKGNKQRGLCT